MTVKLIHGGCYVVSDERALVLAARNLGFVFKTRLPDCVSIEVVCIIVVVMNNVNNKNILIMTMKMFVRTKEKDKNPQHKCKHASN